MPAILIILQLYMGVTAGAKYSANIISTFFSLRALLLLLLLSAYADGQQCDCEIYVPHGGIDRFLIAIRS